MYDFLDTDIPYDEIPQQYLPQPAAVRPTPAANMDAGRQLQQTIAGAFRRAAGPANTDEYKDRATEAFDSTLAHVKNLANDHEELGKRCEKLLSIARYRFNERAIERLQQIQQVDSVNIGRHVADFLDRMHDIQRLLTRGKYKDVYLRSCNLCDEYGGVRQHTDQLQESVDELAESF